MPRGTSQRPQRSNRSSVPKSTGRATPLIGGAGLKRSHQTYKCGGKTKTK